MHWGPCVIWDTTTPNAASYAKMFVQCMNSRLEQIKSSHYASKAKSK